MSIERSKAAEHAFATLAEVGIEKFMSSDFRPGTVRRVVLTKYKKDVSEELRRQSFLDTLNLKNICLRDGAPYIVSIEGGPQVNGQGYDAGYDYVFIATFKSEGDSNFYSGASFVDPTKEENKKHFDVTHFEYLLKVLPLLEGVIVTTFIA
jgi:hypothetical protein